MPAARKSASAPKRVRVDDRKAISRQRLIDATIDIVRNEGTEALTTVKIASVAGLKQPAFYAHFKNVDECLHAAAEQMQAHLIATDIRVRRERVPMTAEGDQLNETIERMQMTLGIWMENKRFAALLGRCRFDATPLGQRCRDAIERSRLELRDDLMGIAMQVGLRARYLRELELMSSLLIEGFCGALSLLVSDAYDDVAAVGAALGRSQYHYVTAELRRMLREQTAEK